MADFSFWDNTVPSGIGAGAVYTDATGRTQGLEFYVTAKRWLKSIKLYKPVSTVTNPTQGQVWLVNGTVLTGSAVTFSGVTGTGWFTANLTTPIELTPNQRYRAGVRWPGGSITGASNWWSSGPGASGVTSDVLVAPSSANATGQMQGPYNVGGSLTFPNTTNTSKAWYGVDVVVTDVDPAPSATLKSASDSPVATISDSSTINRLTQFKPDETQANNVLAGWDDDSWQRQTATPGAPNNGYNDNSVPYPIPYVDAPGGRPGKALNFTIPDNYIRYEVVYPEYAEANIGDSFYYGLAFYLGANFPLDATNYQLIDQLHQGWGSFSPPIEFDAHKGGLFLNGGYGLPNGNTNPTEYQYTNVSLVASLEKERWYNLIYYVENFSETPGASKITVWVDGVNVLDQFTIPCPTIVQGATYRKSGIYHSSTIVTGGTVYQAGHAIGKSYAYVDPYKELTNVPKSGNDSITVTDTATDLSTTQTKTDSLSITDTRTDLQTSQTKSDSIVVTDASQQIAISGYSDSIAITDSASVVKNEFKAVSDTLSITESATINVTQTRADNLTITDSYVSNTVSRTVTDAISITENATSYATQAVIDSWVITDTVIDQFQGFPKVGNDLVTVIDTFQTIIATQTRTETLALTDTAAVAVTRALTDSITITETASINVLSSDSIAVTDKHIMIAQSRQDSISISDAHIVGRNASDNIASISEGPVSPNIQAKDTISLADTYQSSSAWITKTDSISVTEAFQGFFTFAVHDDIATISDTAGVYITPVMFEDLVLYRDPTESANFRLIAQNIFTKEFIHWNLPLSNPRLNYKLTAPNVLRADVNTEIESLMNLDPPLVEHATWIHVEEAGTIRGSFILEPFIDENGKQKRTIEAIGFSDYLNWLHYQGEEYNGIQVDPADILRKLWYEAQRYQDGNLGVLLNPDTKTPVKLGTEAENVEFQTGSGENVSFVAGPYDLNWWEVTNLGTAAKKLYKDTPMEYVERSWWNDTKTDVMHMVDFRYPRTGNKRDELIFRQGENMKEPIPKVTKTGDSLSSDFIFVGAGEGRNAIRTSTSRRTGRLRRTHVIQNEDVKDIQLAKNIVNFEANRVLRGGTIIDKIVVNTEHINAPWGSFEQGDDIYVEGRVSFYGKVAGYYRIVAYDYDRRTKEATLDLSPSESFSYGVV